MEDIKQTTGREYYSLADISTFEEENIEGYRGELDANASLPPLPHDVYMFSVAYAEEDVAKRWSKGIAKDGKVLWMTFLRLTSANNADPANDGRSWTEVLTTYPNKRGTTGAQALLQGLEIDTIALGSHQSQILAIDQAISGGAAFVGAETDWQGRMFDKEAIARDEKTGNAILNGDGSEKKGVELWSIRGMRNFPKNEDGTYRSEITRDDGYKMKDGTPLPDSLLPVRAFMFVRRWVPQTKLMRVEAAEAAQDLTPALEQSIAQTQAAKPAASAATGLAQSAAPPAARPAAPAAPAAATPGRPPARPPVRRVQG